MEDIKEMVEQSISKEQGGLIMTLAEQLKHEGMQQGTKGLLSRLITRRFPVNSEEVQPIFTDLTTEQLEELGERLFEAESMDDIRRWADEMRRKK